MSDTIDPLPSGTIIKMRGNHNLPDGRFVRAHTVGVVIYGGDQSDPAARRAVSFVGIEGVHSIKVTDLEIVQRPDDEN